MKDFAELLGWIIAIGYGIAFANFLLKYINRKYIVKVPKSYKKYVDYYRIVMRYVIRYHKLAGYAAAIALITHFFIMYNIEGLSITGLAAAIIMLVIIALGAYGAFINKNFKGSWLKIHRNLSFLLLISIASHLLI
ncbi:hypothetical protein SAMN02745248_01256 [Hathewaya proteolytica DSM 3090]|uniref:Uncharacterized protein n=1 Tax=Hathewaya proteolytica DSM 3090 TaxID=1121331 RepID=A0A1M6N3U1_9CLOT|nr:hypothetical protein [Hathewaya proteolytica]SHJ90354.1 hypothetical protein SAMN02745248_01256 [Hathewaya proteolytica DSM 3090]